MAVQTYNINFNGYFLTRENIPAESGIYCVYVCVYDGSKTVNLNELIYIGESQNMYVRLADHEKETDWNKRLKTGEQLCYSFGTAPQINRKRCEAALIFKHKPPINTEYTNAFPFDQTTLNLSGTTAELQTPFTVYRVD